MTLFRHIWFARLCTGTLLVGTILWLVVPQAFVASTSSDTGGWVQHFVDVVEEQPDVRSVPEGGMQSTSNLLIQPVLAAGSAPTVSLLRVSMPATHGMGNPALVHAVQTAQVHFEGVDNRSPFPVILTGLQPKGP